MKNDSMDGSYTVLTDKNGSVAYWEEPNNDYNYEPLEDCITLTIRSWYPAWLVRFLTSRAIKKASK